MYYEHRQVLLKDVRDAGNRFALIDSQP